MIAFGPIVILLVLIVIAVVVAIASGASKASSESRPNGFPWLLMLLGIVIVSGVATVIIVQSRPVVYVLEVNVPSGKPFIGEVIIDGRREIIDGIGSKTFEFTGKVIRWRVLIDDDAGNDSISVQLTGGVGGSSSSTWGAAGSAEKRFIGGGGMSTSVSEDEWRTLMRELRPEENEAEDSLLPGFSAPSNPVDDDGNEPEAPADSPEEDEATESSAGT